MACPGSRSWPADGHERSDALRGRAATRRERAHGPDRSSPVEGAVVSGGELYRSLAHESGAQVLVVPAAFMLHTGRDHWEVLLRARAIENQCYVIAAGQIGDHEPGRSCFGELTR